MTKKCVLCEIGVTRDEPVVHETCHDQEIKDRALYCVECEGPFAEISVDQLVAELRAIYLPHCRPVVA